MSGAHGRYGGTVYLVQPDLKHGPGGLRDWAATRWCLRATHGTDDLQVLQQQGHVGPRVAKLLETARGTLLRLRAAEAPAARLGKKHGGTAALLGYTAWLGEGKARAARQGAAAGVIEKRLRGAALQAPRNGSATSQTDAGG